MRTGRFFQWLVQQAERDDQVDELVRRIIQDREFPRWVASRDSAREYLQSCGIGGRSLDALDQVWDEFEKTEWGM